MEKKIIAFYKYVEIENPVEFRKRHLAFCRDLGLRGRILVAREGINGSVCGDETQIEKYKEKLRQDSKFSDIEFKEDFCLEWPFRKISVKVKKEIVRFEQDVDLSRKGNYISPQEFLELYANGEVDKGEVVIVDARNNYESRVGRFKGAITPDIELFKDFPKAVRALQAIKDKKIVMYCTGGIRCEKASAYLVRQGFKNVSQLRGGILAFAKEFPDSVWEGKCFVFDKRLIVGVNNDGEEISACEICGGDCDLYRNCKNKKCDKLTVLCLNCEDAMSGCCSDACFFSYEKELKEKEERNRGKKKDSTIEIVLN